jgi:hypothetical protein
VVALGIGSVVSLAFAARSVPSAELAAALRSVRPGPALGVIVVFALNHAVRTARTRVLLPPTVPLGRVVSACFVGFFAISVLPLRLGELARPAVLARDGVPLEVSVAAILVERVLDLVVLLLLLAWAGLAVHLPGGLVVSGIDVLPAAQRTVGTLAVVLIAGLIGAAAVGPAAAGRVPVVGGAVARFAGALRALVAAPGRAALAVLFTVLAWSTAAAYVGVGLSAVPGLPSDARTTWLTWTAIAATTTVLPTPGFVGSFEAGAVEALAWLGAPRAPAFAFALALHVAWLAWAALLGLGALVWDRRGWKVLVGR